MLACASMLMRDADWLGWIEIARPLPDPFRYETGYKNGSVTFGQDYVDVHVKNNAGVVQREPKDQLLVAVYNRETKTTSLQVSNRRGGNLKELTSVPENAEWHVDVKNSKVRVVQQMGSQLRIESLEW